jgi:RNA polymerase sigma-70 factor, ECF subfamily
MQSVKHSELVEECGQIEARTVRRRLINAAHHACSTSPLSRSSRESHILQIGADQRRNEGPDRVFEISLDAASRLSGQFTMSFPFDLRLFSVDARRIFRRSAARPAATSDEQLLLQIQQRSKRALAVLYDRSASDALGLAVAILQDDGLAEEVTQQAFWQVWQRATELSTARGSFLTYFFSTVRELAITELQRREAMTPRPLDKPLDMVLGPLSSTNGDEELTAATPLLPPSVYSMLAKFPTEQRQVIELAYFAGLTYTEISQALGEPLVRINTWAQLGLNQLCELIQDNYDEQIAVRSIL